MYFPSDGPVVVPLNRLEGEVTSINISVENKRSIRVKSIACYLALLVNIEVLNEHFVLLFLNVVSFPGFLNSHLPFAFAFRTFLCANSLKTTFFRMEKASQALLFSS